jgi:hypothetical protein
MFRIITNTKFHDFYPQIAQISQIFLLPGLDELDGLLPTAVSCLQVRWWNGAGIEAMMATR